MTKNMILLASTLLLSAISGQALAYSNVSPKPSHETRADQQFVSTFKSSDQMAAQPDGADAYRYHGGPKADD
jgi:hypothetical protein